jgi:hypothetical protein
MQPQLRLCEACSVGEGAACAGHAGLRKFQQPEQAPPGNHKSHVVYKGISEHHFTSTIFEHQTPKVYHMLLKISPEDQIYRKYIDVDILFHNETLMHKEVIPFFEKLLTKRQAVSLGKIFPKCYYANCGAGDTDIVVPENMAP